MESCSTKDKKLETSSPPHGKFNVNNIVKGNPSLADIKGALRNHGGTIYVLEARRS